MSLIKGEDLQEMSAEDLIALDLNQVQDVEGFKAIPPGLYSFTVKEFSIDEFGKDKKKAIKVDYELSECVELVNETDQEEASKLEFPRKHNELYFLDGGKGFGVRMFATTFRELAKEQKWNNIQEVMEGAVGFTGQALLKKRSYEKDGETLDTNQIDAQTVVFD